MGSAVDEGVEEMKKPGSVLSSKKPGSALGNIPSLEGRVIPEGWEELSGQRVSAE